MESKYSPLHLPSGPLQLSEQEKAFFNFLSVIEAPGSFKASVDPFSLYLYGVGGFLYYKTHGCAASLKSEPQFWVPGKKVTAKYNVHLRQGLNYLVVQENKASTTLNFETPTNTWPEVIQCLHSKQNNPEPQVITEAIAKFSTNNEI